MLSDGSPIPAPAGKSASLRAFAIIMFAAVIALSPELFFGLTVTDNFRFNLLWPEQFDQLVRSGHLYPRWLPRSWDGYGSPVFYFYPPMFFWATAAVNAAAGGTLSPERFVPLASLALLASSGLAMRGWLKARTGEWRALIGALAYMLAPYHLYDVYCRGALTEASAYAFLPVVMLALDRLGRGRSAYLPALAIGYAALLFSHLPSALLVSLFLVPPYVAFIAARSERPARFLVQALLGGLLGLAIAAVYIVPALALLPYVSPNWLSGSFYSPDSWFFWSFPSSPMGGRMYFIIPVSVSAGLIAAGVCAARASLSRAEPLFWAALTLFLILMISGLVPGIWKLPGLSFVQFPWRALLLVEFATVTMLASCAPFPRNLFVLAGLGLMALSFAMLASMAGHTIGRTAKGQAQTAAEIRARYFDAPEYLPSGTRIAQGEGPDRISFNLPVLPLASAIDRRATVSASETSDGRMDIAIESPSATRLILRRFYFPRWRVFDAKGRSASISRDERGVVSLQTGPGRSAYHLVGSAAPSEIAAGLVTMLGLMCLASISLARVVSGTFGRSRTRGPLMPENEHPLLSRPIRLR